MNEKSKWTFMVYLAGDNNLSEAGETDLGEMAAVGSSADVNLVAEFDRVGAEAHSKRYYVQKDSLHEVVDLDETDCGDPNVLLDYVNWAAENYPAERYALILWNHGSGWEPSSIDTIAQEVGTKHFGRAEGIERSGTPLRRAFFRSTVSTIMTLETSEERAICCDDGSGHSLDTLELGKVLHLATEKLGQPLDLLGMDACLMSNLEVAYQARPYVRYVVASEENEPGDGWPYDAVLGKLVAAPDLATPDLAAHIVDAYIKSYVGRHYSGPVTQAALDLSRVRDLVEPLDELAGSLIARMPDVAAEVWRAQRKSARFWHNTLWDVSHFCEELEETADDGVRRAAHDVRAALAVGPGNCVIAEGHNGAKVERCGGVTIYLMPPLMDVSRYYGELDYARDHRWLAMLEAYHAA
jgi:hypothetical protein